VPGYTGFIPKIQNNFATTFTCASRVAMSCPPTPVCYDCVCVRERERGGPRDLKDDDSIYHT